MIRSASVDDAARLTGPWRPAGLRFRSDLAGRELVSVAAVARCWAEEETEVP